MSLDFHSTSTSEPAVHEPTGMRVDWREQSVTLIGTTVGVLIVAIIAVLMGLD